MADTNGKIILKTGPQDRWRAWDDVLRSTYVWFFALLVGFIVAVFIGVLVIAIGANLSTALVIPRVYGWLAVEWTIVAIVFRRHISERRPEILQRRATPIGEDHNEWRGYKHALRRAVEPALIVLVWSMGVYLILSSLVVEMYVEFEGEPAPFWLVAISRSVFSVALGALVVAVCGAPLMYRWGRREPVRINRSSSTDSASESGAGAVIERGSPASVDKPHKELEGKLLKIEIESASKKRDADNRWTLAAGIAIAAVSSLLGSLLSILVLPSGGEMANRAALGVGVTGLLIALAALTFVSLAYISMRGRERVDRLDLRSVRGSGPAELPSDIRGLEESLASQRATLRMRIVDDLQTEARSPVT
jgi:hypothetical protein